MTDYISMIIAPTNILYKFFFAIFCSFTLVRAIGSHVASWYDR